MDFMDELFDGFDQWNKFQLPAFLIMKDGQLAVDATQKPKLRVVH